MYAGKNKSKKSRNIATSEESLELSSTDSRYDAGDYEAVPASIRKVRDERRREQKEKLEEANAIPASEIIAQQEAEIARLKEEMAKQSGPKSVADIYRNAVDDNEEHPTFKNPESMADFGDYEAVAASARPGAASHDPDQKVFRAKPAVKTRGIAKPSQLSDGDYEAVAAGARRAVPPDEYKPATDEDLEARIEQENAAAPAPVSEPEPEPEPAYTEPEPEPVPEPAYTEPEPEPEPAYTEPEPEYEAPKPAPAPVSAADYMIKPEEPEEPEYEAPKPAPAPVSAADYMVKPEEPEPEPVYTAPEPEPVYEPPKPAPEPPQDYIKREIYIPPSQRNTKVVSSSYTAQPYTPPAQRYDSSYSSDGYEPDAYTPQSPSGRKIASVMDLAPGDYEAVATSSIDDSDMDLADGSYDFDKFLAGAPSLQMHPVNEPSPEEVEWADLGTQETEPDEPDITEEQTRALTEALAQETLQNQPGTQFEDIIDNVIAKVLERKKAEDAARNAKRPAEEKQPEPAEKQPEPEEEPAPVEEKQPEPEKEPVEEKQPEPEKEPEEAHVRHSLEPDCIPDDASIDDIPALIVAELDSIDGEVTEDDIHKTVDAALISRLTAGELTLDSVQTARSRILDEIKEMQEEEARILAELSGEKHEFRTGFLPVDIKVEDIPDAIISELDKVEGEVSDEDVKKSIDTVLIAKLAKGDLTLDTFEGARDDIFDALGIEQESEQKDETSEETEPLEEDPAEEAEPEEELPAEEQPEEAEPEEAPAEEEPAETPAEETVPEEKAEEAPEEISEEEAAADNAEEEPETEQEEAPAEEAKPEEEPPAEEAAEPEEALVEEPFSPINTENVEYMVDRPEPEEEPEPIEEAVPAEEPLEEEPEPEVQEEPEPEEEKASAEEPASEANEEEEEKTVPIPVPKEPSVLQYDPYKDVFVNPEPEEETLEEKQDAEEPEESEEADEAEEAAVEAGETEEESLEEVPLSAAAALANQNQEEDPEGAEDTAEEVSAMEEESAIAEENTQNEPIAEEEPAAEEEIPEEPAEEHEISAESAEETDTSSVPEEENAAEPEKEPEEISATEEESAIAEKNLQKEPIAEKEPVDMQMTFDDIFRNPFVNDFEPLDEPAQEKEEAPAEETEAEEEAPSEDTEAEEEPQEDESPADETKEANQDPVEPLIEEKVEIDEIFEESEQEEAEGPEPESDQEEAPAEEEQPEEEPTAEARSEEDLKTEKEENLQKFGVNFVTEEEERTEEEQEDYSEVKAQRHEEMQNALLMAMVDGSDSSFGETVNSLMERADINVKTLLSRMPIDREELNKALSDYDYKPDKKTAIAVCFALRLTWEDSVRLLYKAGHVLSDSRRYDLTIEYLMRRGVYDQNMINSVLRGSGLDGFGIPQAEI